MQRIRKILSWIMVGVLTIPGCAWHRSGAFHDPDLAHYQEAALRTEYADVEIPADIEAASTPAPLTINDREPPEFWDMSLQEAVRTALERSTVLRDLGGFVLQSPESVRTSMDTALRETDPRFGVEAALAAFDASFEASAFAEKNDRALNNVFFGGGTRLLEQDLAALRAQISKRTAIGTDLTIRNIMDYDNNNSPGNQFFGAWNEIVEAEFRQPLLQGAGLEFNRIAGPGNTPGVYNGVLVARTNTDIMLADFEMGVRNLVNDVETAYWELYYAFRELDARIAARDRALETWRSIHSLNVTGRRGGEAEKEAQAREQYYRLEEEVQNSLTGRLSDRVRSIVFRGAGGVQVNERRLRLLMGMPASDGKLIRPVDEPLMAKMVFNWEEILTESMTRREELRKQRWQVKRRELEFAASRNFLLPKLDTVGRYRFRGFGKDLLNSSPQLDPYDNAFQSLTSGDFQEWQVGMELQTPFGFRKGHAAYRNAQLAVCREKAILEEQEREVAHDLSNAYSEVDRAYKVSQTNYNRRLAAQEQLAALEELYRDADEGEKTRLLDLLLDAQRRLSDSESNFYRSMCEYTLAVRQVHYQKGSLLDYNEVYLNESRWPDKAYDDAQRRDRNRNLPPEVVNYALKRMPNVSQGAYEAQQGIGGQMETPATPTTVTPAENPDISIPDRVPAPVVEPDEEPGM